MKIPEFKVFYFKFSSFGFGLDFNSVYLYLWKIIAIVYAPLFFDIIF